MSAEHPTRPVIRGTFGSVASTHWLATAVGMSVLEAGGNAFDAAAAAGLTLHVVEPHLNGLGGDTPIVLYDARSDASHVICGQGVSPAAATIEAFEEQGLDLVPGTGHLPAVVPGSWGAWTEMLLRFGTMRLRDVVRPAIEYAAGGYPLVPNAVSTIAGMEQLFREHWPTSAATYLGDGVPAAYSRFRNPDLAATLERLVAEAEASGHGDREAEVEAGRAAFYEGFVAEAIGDFLRRPVRDASGRDHAGLLTADDLAGWRATLEAPLSAGIGDWTVLKTGPWGQGPVLLQQLQLLDGLDLPALLAEPELLVHRVVEAAKLAFADRDAYYADPTVVDVPMSTLLSPAYADARRALITEVASDELRPGAAGDDPEAALTRLLSAATPSDRPAAAPGTGEPTVPPAGVPRGDTCHVDVADRWGNLVSATPSGGWLQSSPVVPGLGISVSTRGQMFWLDRAHPAALAPRRRPRTTLSPGLVARDGRPFLAYGTPGGDQQDQWTVPFLLRHLVGGMDLQAAIDAPAWHTTHLVSSFYPRRFDPRGVEVEPRIGAEVMAGLRRRGHDVRPVGDWALGRISAAGYVDGFVQAAANARGAQGYAAGR